MPSISDILTSIQQGVVAVNNLVSQTKGSFLNIQSQLSSNSLVKSFNARTGVVVPTQGDYPTNLIPGTSTNDNAIAGNIGEYLTSTVSSGSAVNYSAATFSNLTTLNITSGDWEARGMVGFFPSGAFSQMVIWTSSASASFPSDSIGNGSVVNFQATFGSGLQQIMPCGVGRFSVANSTTIYLNFLGGGSSGKAFGILIARRVR